MYQREKKLHSLTLERHEPWTPVLAPQFQPLTQQAVVVLSDTGDRALKPCLCSSQAKSEEVFHRGILDHPNLLDANMEGKGYSSTNRDHLRDEMRRHPSRKCTVRSPVPREIIGRRECASALQQLMNLPVQIQKAWDDDGSQEHDRLLFRENPQTLHEQSKRTLRFANRCHNT